MAEFPNCDDAPLYDQRRFERHKVGLTATVWLIDMNDCEEGGNKAMLSQPRTAFIEDLSLSGVLFVSYSAFPIGSIVGIRIRLGAQSLQVEAIVRRRLIQQV